jgi:hypothetical protein
VPPTFESWRVFAFGILERYARMSPSVTRELEIVSALKDYHSTPAATTTSVDVASLVPPPPEINGSSNTFSHLDDEADHRHNTRSSRRGSLHVL